ncbi:hypothetical protein JCM3770_005822 [Rhodotorula araucariae]
MPLFLRASPAPPSLDHSSQLSPHAPTPPLSSTSHTSLDSSSVPATPPLPPGADARQSHAWSLVSTSGPADHFPPPSSFPGSRLRDRVRSKSRSREPGGGDRGTGKVGRFFRRIGSRKSLRGDATEQDRADGCEGYDDDDDPKVPPLPSLPPQLELLQLPPLGPEIALREGETGRSEPTLFGGQGREDVDELTSLLMLVHAAGDKFADPVAATHEATHEATPAVPPLATPIIQPRFRSSQTATVAPRPTSTVSIDEYGEASDDEDTKHAWNRSQAPLRPASLIASPPTSAVRAGSSPSPPTPPTPKPVVSRLVAHAVSRLSPSPAPPFAATPFAAPLTTMLPPPRSTHAVTAVSTDHPSGPAVPLRLALAHCSLLKKLQHGATHLDAAELASTIASSSRLSRSPLQSDAHSTATPLLHALPRLGVWAARPSYAARTVIYSSNGAADIPSPRVRGAGLHRSCGLRAWLVELGVAAADTDDAGPTRASRERPPREARRGAGAKPVAYIPVASVVDPFALPTHAGALQPPSSPPPRTPVLPGPLLLRALARQEAEDALVGGAALGTAPPARWADVLEDDDDDARPLASLRRPPVGPPAVDPDLARGEELRAARRQAAELAAEVDRLRAREAQRRAVEAATREREAGEEKSRRRAEEQRRRSRAMHAAASPGSAAAQRAGAAGKEARRRSTLAPALAPAAHSIQQNGAYLAVPAQAWGMSMPTVAVPLPGRVPVPVPMYQLPLHALSAPNVQTLQHRHSQTLMHPHGNPHSQQRHALLPPSRPALPHRTSSPPPRAAPQIQAQQHSLRAPSASSRSLGRPSSPSRNATARPHASPSSPPTGRRVSFRSPAPLPVLDAPPGPARASSGQSGFLRAGERRARERTA